MSPDPAGREPRRPRFLSFLVTGAVAGLVATAVLVLTAPEAGGSWRRLTLYLGVLLGGLGALAGGVVAVWLDRDRDPAP